MGFVIERYNNNRAGLTVDFLGDENMKNYYAGDSVTDALAYFNMYVQDNCMYVRTDDEIALQAIGIGTAEEAAQLRQAIEHIVEPFTDEQAVAVSILFPNWMPGTAYAADERVRYQGVLYKILQQHTSQADWLPPDTPSLYARLLTPEDETPAEWEQPDSTNPYMTGDRVSYRGQVYESVIDGNIWSPEEYAAGWKLVD